MVNMWRCLQVWISIWWYELFGVSLPILHSYVFDIESVRNIPWYKRNIDKILQTLITEWNEKCALFLFVFDVGPILCKNMKNDVFNNNQTERINKRIGIIIKETITLIITRYTLNDYDNQIFITNILRANVPFRTAMNTVCG